MQYVLLAAAPGLAICIYIFYRDIYNKEPPLNLIISFVLGGLSILLAQLIEGAFSVSDKVITYHDATVPELLVFAYCIVGVAEEGGKFLGLRLYSYNQKAFDEPLDGIVYAVMVSMGFATVENILYAISFKSMTVVLTRMVLTVPAHATFAVIMGYFVGKAKFNKANGFKLMLIGFLGAVFFHGTFDFFFFASNNQVAGIGQDTANNLLAGGAIVSFIISLVLCRKLIRQHRALSKQMFDHKPPPHNA